MKWSWRIGTLAGIPVFVHPTFFLIFAWVLLRTGTDGGWRSAIFGILYIITLFGCVVLHELGHALTARRFGISTRDITLLPIGGVARLERMPRDPKQELLVALAGPAVNVVIATVLYLLLGGWPRVEQLGLQIDASNFFPLILVVNVFLVVFNLLPAFPMDGGRVLRLVGHGNQLPAGDPHRRDDGPIHGRSLFSCWPMDPEPGAAADQRLCMARRLPRSEGYGS